MTSARSISAFIALSVIAGFGFLLLVSSQTASGATFTVTSTDNAGPGSLREAITNANADGLDTITFDETVFPSGAPATIALTSELPASTDPAGLTIDGTGAGVIIDGSNLVGSEIGLHFHTTAGESLTDVTVRNVTVQNFPDDGIKVCGGEPSGLDICDEMLTDTLIEGVTSNGNGSNGISIDGLPNLRSTVSNSEASSNGSRGVNMNGGSGSDLVDALVEDTAANANGSIGFNLNASANNTGSTVSGSTANGNNGSGININAGDNNVDTTVTGNTLNNNGSRGINLNAGDQLVNATVSNNTANDNDSNGVGLNSGAENFDTIVSGNTVLRNGSHGLFVNTNDPFEGTGASIANNTVSDNTSDGIDADVEGTIEGNTVTGNGDSGIQLRRPGVTIANNVISGNAAHGIDGDNDGGMTITGNTITNNLSTSSAVRIPGTGNEVTDNTISDNAGDGIDNGFNGAGMSTFTGNTVTNNGEDGIVAGQAGNNTIAENFVSGSSSRGIQAFGTGNTVVGNTVLDNAADGIRLSEADNLVRYNRIEGNGTGLGYFDSAALDATLNWWGCNEGPNTTDCDTATEDVDFEPWLVLTISADPDPAIVSGNNTIFATVTDTSDSLSPAGLPDHILDGTLILFETDSGDLGAGASRERPTNEGVAETPFNPGAPGTASITATLDNETVMLELEAIEASETPTGGPTATPTPTPTGGPTATPTPTPTGEPELIQGDVDCDGDVDAVDALQVLRDVAGLQTNQEPGCPDIGAEVASLFGDVDCDDDVDAVDALQVLRHVAGLPVNQQPGCPEMGSGLG